MVEPMPSEDRDLLAAEFAFGLLGGDDRAQATRMMLADRAFADAVAVWQARIAPLHAGYASHQPAPDLWSRIAVRLAEEPGPGIAAPGGNVTALQQQVARWRTGAVVAGLAAVASFALLFLQPARVDAPLPPPVAPTAMAIAQLSGDTGEARITARYAPDTAELMVRSAGVPAGELVPELWVIPDDGTPRSLGLIARSGVRRMAVAADHRMLIAEGATLAVTMEPAATAPNPAPSSPIIASGQISMI